MIKSKKEIEETLPQKIKKQCNIDMCIINRLESIKDFLKSDRLQIYDFHNGIHYANGRSALKTSCSYEVVRAGIKGHQKELQSHHDSSQKLPPNRSINFSFKNNITTKFLKQ